MKYNIGKEFCDTPAGREKSDGDFTGEHFREDVLKVLIKNLSKNEKLVIILDDAEGYGSSFLDEAFGGTVRQKYISSNKLLSLLEFEYEDEDFEFFENKIREYIQSAEE